MGCCSSSPQAKGDRADIQNAKDTGKAAESEEFAYAKLHKLVESELPNPTLEILTVFPAAFSLSAAAAVLEVSEDMAKQQLQSLEEKKLVQLAGNQYALTPMVRHYVVKLAGERNHVGRSHVLRTYVHLVLKKMHEIDKALESTTKDGGDTKVQQQHKADFTEVLTLVAKHCSADDGLLDNIGAPDSLQTPNVYTALGLWNHAATMWAAVYRVLQARLPAGDESHAPLVSGEEDPSSSPLSALATCAYNQGEAHRAMHNAADAEDCYKEALRLWEGLLPDEDPRMMRCLSLMAACLKERKDMAAAEQCYERLLAACQNVMTPNNAEFLHAVRELAECLEAQGKVREAQPLKALAFKSM